MPTYSYRPQAAIDTAGNLTATGAGQVFATPTGGSPLVVRDLAGLSMVDIPVSAIGQTAAFEIDDYPEVYWRSGDVTVHLWSVTGIIEAVDASKNAALDAAAAAAASAAAAAGAGGGGGNVYFRDYSAGTYPARGTLPSGAVVIWRGPTAPLIGAGGALANVDEWEVTAS